MPGTSELDPKPGRFLGAVEAEVEKDHVGTRSTSEQILEPKVFSIYLYFSIIVIYIYLQYVFPFFVLCVCLRVRD